HDAGLTAWWVLAVGLGAIIFNFIFSLIFTPFFMGPEEMRIQEEMTERMLSGDWAGMTEGAEILASKLLPLSIATIIVSNAVVAIVLGVLKTEPRENKHGPVPGSSAADTFE
ncbi:MAG: hypothetical protein AAFP81_04040, partial [Pseudomonadota bacterium]